MTGEEQRVRTTRVMLVDDHPEFRILMVLIMSNLVDPYITGKALRAGADEVLDKFASLEETVATVRRLGRS